MLLYNVVYVVSGRRKVTLAYSNDLVSLEADAKDWHPGRRVKILSATLVPSSKDHQPPLFPREVSR